MKFDDKVTSIKNLDTLTAGVIRVSQPDQGWLRTVREALGRTRASIAEHLGVSIPSIQDYERSEQAGRITLATLRRYADALDCDVVVAVVPRNEQTFGALSTGTKPPSPRARARSGPIRSAPAQPTGSVMTQPFAERLGLWTAD